jgi:hypothetical protein
MGFTTKGEDTQRKTYHFRDDVVSFIEGFAEQQSWDYSDVVNRAVLYYAWQAQENELDDPMVGDNMQDVVEEISSDDSSRDITDLLRKRK